MATLMDWLNANATIKTWTKSKVSELMNRMNFYQKTHRKSAPLEMFSAWEDEKKEAWERINLEGGYDALED